MSTGWLKYKELTSGVILLAFSAWYYSNAATIRILSRRDFINSQFFPRILGMAMIIMSVIQIFYGVKAMMGGKAQENKIEGGSDDDAGNVKPLLNWSGSFRILITIVNLAVYIALIRQVGFLIMTIAYVFLQILVLVPKAKRNLLFTAVLSVVFSVAVYLMFVEGFQLMLPRGHFF